MLLEHEYGEKSITDSSSWENTTNNSEEREEFNPREYELEFLTKHQDKDKILAKLERAFDMSEEFKRQLQNKFHIEEIPFLNSIREETFITLENTDKVDKLTTPPHINSLRRHLVKLKVYKLINWKQLASKAHDFELRLHDYKIQVPELIYKSNFMIDPEDYAIYKIKGCTFSGTKQLFA
jgi:hypothetical protein